MEPYFLKKSTFDPLFWEVVFQGEVIREIQVRFALKQTPPEFFSMQEIDTWLKEQELKLAKAYAYYLLNRQAYATKALLKKLTSKGYSSDVSHTVVLEIEKIGYLSDKELAKTLINRKVREGYGPFYIQRYLKEKGLDASGHEIDEKQALQKSLQKFKGKEKSKVIAALTRRGFSIELILSHFSK